MLSNMNLCSPFQLISFLKHRWCPETVTGRRGTLRILIVRSSVFQKESSLLITVTEFYEKMIQMLADLPEHVLKKMGCYVVGALEEQKKSSFIVQHTSSVQKQQYVFSVTGEIILLFSVIISLAWQSLFSPLQGRSICLSGLIPYKVI